MTRQTNVVALPSAANEAPSTRSRSNVAERATLAHAAAQSSMRAGHEAVVRALLLVRLLRASFGGEHDAEDRNARAADVRAGIACVLEPLRTAALQLHNLMIHGKSRAERSAQGILDQLYDVLDLACVLHAAIRGNRLPTSVGGLTDSPTAGTLTILAERVDSIRAALETAMREDA